MTLFVDTSVWSLAFRRDQASTAPEVRTLRHALEGGEIIVATGLVLQELLQGFAGRRARKDLIDRSRPSRSCLLTGRITSAPQSCEIAVVAPACKSAPLTP